MSETFSTFGSMRNRIAEFYFKNRFFTLFLAAWIIIFLIFRTLQHFSFQTNAYDLSIFDYMMSFTLKGECMAEPFHGYWGSHFAIHFTPILYFFLPFYIILKGPLFLLYIQVIIGGLSALVLYRIFKASFASGPIPALLSVSYLLFRPFQNGIMYDFHPEMMFPLFLFSAYYYAAVKRNHAAYFIFIALALLIKEDVALFLFFFGIFLFFKLPEKRSLGFITSLSALSYFIITMGVIIPYFRRQLGMSTMFEFAVLWKSAGDNVFEIIKTLASHPLSLFSMIHWNPSLIKFLGLFASLLFIPFFSWKFMLVLPPVFILSMSDSAVMQGFGLHYIAGLLPFLFLALGDGLKNIAGLFREKKTAAKISVILACSILIISTANTRWNLLKPSRYSGIRDYASVKSHIRLIPDNASIASLSSLIPHIPKRKNISMLPDMKDAEYILVHTGVNSWPYRKEDLIQELNAMKDNPEFECVSRDSTIFLFRKKPRRH